MTKKTPHGKGDHKRNQANQMNMEEPQLNQSAETGQYINGEKIVHAWFAGYFPRMNRHSVSVFVENGKSGGSVAAPIFEEIARDILNKGL